MQANNISGMRVAILVTDDFEQAELAEPKKALDQAGATTKIISPKPGQVQGMNHDVKADTFPVDMTFDQANPNDFDAVLLPGGALNADALRMEPKAQEFVRDGTWASSRSPKDLPAFNKGMIELFSGSKVTLRQ
jgi:protease I